MKSKLMFMMGLVWAFTANAGQEYTVDNSHTEVGFSVKHMVVATVRGTFTEFSGKVFYDEQDVSKSTVEGVVKVASINTSNTKRDEHLRGADFFDAAAFPEILFKSKKVEKAGDGFVVIGDLTMRGVTKEVKLNFVITGKVTDPWGNERIGLEASGKINRQEFGVSWNKSLDNGGFVVSDDVKIDILAELIKKKE
jgi:polyisoprenoid-binding protein YceI